MSAGGREFLNQSFVAVNTFVTCFRFYSKNEQELKKIDINRFKNTKAPLHFNQKIRCEFRRFSDGSYNLRENE